MLQMKNITIARTVTIALALSVLVACKKKDEVPAVDTAAMAPPAVVALNVNGVATGKGLNADKTVKVDALDFGVRDTIYVSVKTEGAGTGKLAAKLTYQDGQTVGEPSQDISPTGEANHEFHFAKKTAWPKGNYKVAVTLDGVAAGTKDITIK